uniref:Uncharacterized protein n=1 Tax=Tanacetum cinerariifolium TaxID=118510 RepID=A0A6L2LUY2_TANCI|nr:hypothetical protein [Tanacetum cinerariifolium]
MKSTLPPISDAAKKEKSAQDKPSKPATHMSPFDISGDDDQPNTPANALLHQFRGSHNQVAHQLIKTFWIWWPTTLNNIPNEQFMAQLFISAEKKKKRRIEVARHAFLKAGVRVDGMERNLVPPMGVTTGKHGHVIEQPEVGILFFNGNTNLGFQRIGKFDLATTIQLLRMYSFIILDSDYVRIVADELMLLIESRHDVVEAIECVTKNLNDYEF